MSQDFVAHLQAVFDGASVGVVILDEDLRYVYVNPYLASLNKAPIEAHPGSTIDAMVPGLLSALVPVFERLRRGEVVNGFELEPDTKLVPPGTPWMIGNFFTVRLEGGRRGFGIIVTDASSKRQADLELRASEARYRELFESSPVPMWVLDDDTLCFLAVNEAAIQHYGYTRQEFLAMSLLDIYPLDKALAELFSRDSDEKRTWSGRHRKKNGTIVQVEIRFHRLTFNGRAARLMHIHDVTAQKETENERARLLEKERALRQAAEATSRARDEFLITISHELRTPLTPILGWAQILGAEALDKKTRAMAVRTIVRNVHSETRLIDDLLDMTQITTGKLSLEKTVLDLGELGESVVHDHQAAANAKGVALDWQGPAAPVFVYGDGTRLRQVVRNLLANALKFTASGGDIHVRVEADADQAMLMVRDTGIGIDADFLPYVFDRFRQKDSSTTRIFGGLGIGLTIVKSLVELHGGTVIAQSSGEGCGATFTVRMPLSRISSSPLTQPASVMAGDKTALEGLHILVVEDDADGLTLITSVLRRHGARVTVASAATEALAAFSTEPPDILLSDIGMRGMDGLQLMRGIRAMDAGSSDKLTAMALTAYADAEHRSQALAAGYQQVMAKPFDVPNLLATIQALRKSRAGGRH